MLKSSPSLRLASRCPSTPREVRHPRERFASAIQEKRLLCFSSSHVPSCSLRSNVFYRVRPCGPEVTFRLEKKRSTSIMNPTMRIPRIHCPAPSRWLKEVMGGECFRPRRKLHSGDAWGSCPPGNALESFYPTPKWIITVERNAEILGPAALT